MYLLCVCVCANWVFDERNGNLENLKVKERVKEPCVAAVCSN